MCYLISTGTAEQKVGTALQDLGREMGVEMPHKMSEWMVKWAILEGGIIQLAYKMIKSDSTFDLFYKSFD